MKKNLIFVSNYFGNGGAARVMQTLLDYFSKENLYELKLITYLDDDKKYRIPENIEYITLNSKNKVQRIIELRKILSKNKNSIIISFEYFVNMQIILASRFLKDKIIISERNDPSRRGNDKKKLRNFLYKFSDVLVCQTEEAKEYFPNKIQKKTVVIPNPIKSKLPAAYNGEREKKIVNFCRLEPQKNLKMLIDSFEIVNKKYNDYTLEIYGEGSCKEELEKYIINKKLNKNVKIMPFVKDIHSKILKYKMFVSTSDYEGISNSMIEAMGIGLPTICTDCPCGGARMMINSGENGILIKTGDIIGCANSMIEIIENKELEKKISKNSVKIRDKLSTKKIINEWKKII